MVEDHRGDEQRRIGNPVHAPDPQAVSHRRGPLVIEGDQQCRREPHELPAGEQCFNCSSQRSHHHPQQKQGIDEEEPAESRFPVQIPTAKGADGSAQHKGQNHERNRQPVELELEDEVELLDRDPFPQIDRHVPVAEDQHQGEN